MNVKNYLLKTSECATNSIYHYFYDSDTSTRKALHNSASFQLNITLRHSYTRTRSIWELKISHTFPFYERRSDGKQTAIIFTHFTKSWNVDVDRKHIISKRVMSGNARAPSALSNNARVLGTVVISYQISPF